MILSSGFDAIFESIYLNRRLTPLIGTSSIVVNPVSENYFDKHIIITVPICNKLLIKLSHFNQIESRFLLTSDIDYIYKPYKLIDLPIYELNEVNLVYNKDYYKSIRCLYHNNKVLVEKPSLIEDTEINGELTMLGYLKECILKTF